MSNTRNLSSEQGGNAPSMPSAGQPPALAATGIAGLDQILGGGLPRDHAYLVEGAPGSGKTTLGLKFCITGAEQGERTLYVTNCESKEEVHEVAASHGWSLEGVDVHYHDAREIFGEEPSQSVFRPAEVELPKTVEALLAVIDEINPGRVVIDSLSEIRLLSGDPRWFRRQVLALKEDLVGRQCTTLLCDDGRAPDQPVHSIVHGTIELQQLVTPYGADRRRLRVAKLRARRHQSGYHDFAIQTGAIDVFPRLVAQEYRSVNGEGPISSGVAELDTMFGGGLDRGTAALLLGPSGTGKSIVSAQFAVAAATRGERSAMYLFDERIVTLLQRTRGLGMDLKGPVDHGLLDLKQVDPAQMTPGEFSHKVRCDVCDRGVRLVVLDSLAGYVHAMPDERLLALHLHELLAFLSLHGVTVLMVMAQHGLPGTPRQSPFDLSYIADAVLLLHAFEHAGEIRKAISVYKRRGGDHERTLRELQFGREGIRIGEPLRQFHGIMTGTPTFTGGALPDVP